MVQQDHVVAIVAENSIVDSAWASYVQQQKLPVVGSAIFNIVYEENPDFFSPGETTVSGSYSTLAAAKRLGDTNSVLLTAPRRPLAPRPSLCLRPWLPRQVRP